MPILVATCTFKLTAKLSYGFQITDHGNKANYCQKGANNNCTNLT